jgi:hypothetical protein
VYTVLAALAAKNQAADNRALLMGLVAGLLAAGVIGLGLALSGAVDRKYTGNTIIVSVVLLVAAFLLWKYGLGEA